MRRVPVGELKQGMRLGKPVYGVDGQLYLNRGVVLKHTYITYLKKLRFAEVYIIDERLGDIEIGDVISDQTRREAIRTIKNALTKGQSQNRLGKSLLLQKENLQHSVSRILEELLSRKNLIVNLTDIRQQDGYTFRHCVNVCILSMINGIILGYSPRKLRDLGLGSIVHDLGKVCIPPHILNKPSTLTNEEFNLVKEHPRIGYDILNDQGIFSINVKDIVYQHHERADGSGYPQGLQGEEINPMARIVAIADIYDALLSQRPYRPPYRPYQVIDILTAASGSFDRDILQHFLDHVAAYPVGTMVRLNSGDIGLVIENRVGLTKRPKVRIIQRAGSARELEEPYDIDLADERDLHIAEVLEN